MGCKKKSESIIRDIKRQTRRKFTSEEKDQYRRIKTRGLVAFPILGHF